MKPAIFALFLSILVLALVIWGWKYGVPPADKPEIKRQGLRVFWAIAVAALLVFAALTLSSLSTWKLF